MILRVSSDRDDRRFFWGGGVEIFDFPIFWGRKILASIFWEAWFKKGFFWIFKTCVSIFRVISFNAFWKFLEARGFSGFWLCPPFDHPCHLRSGVLPPPGYGIPLYITVYHYISRTISLFEPMIVRTKINTWLELKCSKKYGRFSTKSSLFHNLHYEPFLL